MPFRIKRGETAWHALRRVAREQVARAIAEAADRAVPADERVHRMRTRLKKARAALALAGGREPRAARRDDRWLRDAGRRLAAARDAGVAEAVLHELVAQHRGRIDRGVRRDLGAVEGLLRGLHPPAGVEACLAETAAFLRRGRRDLGKGGRPRGGGQRSVERGLRASFRAARRTHRAVRAGGGAERLHDWRRAVKRLGYQLRLVRRVAPDLWITIGVPLEALGDRLGAAHDLAALREWIDARGDAVVKDERRRLHAWIDRSAAVMRRQALAAGAPILVHRPKQVARRFGDAWAAWRAR
jgi:hypothetical protein